ncbi:hypothetical protein GJ746_10355 [Klebsiella oxytoca]|uniref:Lipoprotein n=2 Tax=Klebsiella oxytoca TaxID=571 RepID=A0A6B8N296_KLEOX|nr:hypothetical protein [Klebsiella oxytoca]QGN40504.1 hypothetical protein GJ746_10355 [Klebsiella oxytoca]
MRLHLLSALGLCCISSCCFAEESCEVLAGIAAGEASYIYDSAQVKTSGRLHFYSAPAAKCELPAFLIAGDNVEVLRSMVPGDALSQQYRYIRFRDANGQFATGWVNAAGLAIQDNPLPVSNQCRQWAKKAMQQRETDAPGQDNLYQIQGSGRSWFYAMPDEQCRSNTLFLVPGDTVSVQEQSKDDFIEAVYYTADRHIVRGWLKKSRLTPLNRGDSYREDINPLSTDKASRLVTLNLRHDYSCIFYESWSAKKEIRIIVREDHQSEHCRGAGDPETAPAIAYISVDKLSGEIRWPDVAEGFAP